MTLTPDELARLSIFEGIPAEQLAWLCECGEEVVLASGQRMFERGTPARWMFVVVEGVIRGFEEVGGQWLVVATTRRGEVTGMLPFSRMTHYPRHTIAAEPSRVLRVDKRHFPIMLTRSMKMGQRLVAQMSDRVRGDVRLEQQREKMLALGRLSAGLSHELNNPAAALRRATSRLKERSGALDVLSAAMVRCHLDEEALDAVDRLRSAASPDTAQELSPLERSAREEDLLEWLEDNGVSEAWEIVWALVNSGYSVEDLATLAAGVPASALGDTLAWVAAGLGSQALLGEIHGAAQRISELIASIEKYSHMDRSSAHQPTDVGEGIEATLAMLRSRIADQGIRLLLEYEPKLPSIPANAGELNQVWTILAENALDAMPDGGELRLAVSQDEGFVVVQVADTGPGIPGDVIPRIFEPFFTTKDVGEGTGLSLDIARRVASTHQGSIDVESRPGRTVMHVRLPVSPDPVVSGVA